MATNRKRLKRDRLCRNIDVRAMGEIIVSHCTAIILNNGKIATCTTSDTNIAMRRTAEKVGFMEMTEKV